MAAITNSNIPSEQEDFNTEIKSLRIERDALRKDLSTAQVMDDLIKELASREKETQSLRENLDEREIKVEAYNEDLDERDGQIEMLSNDLDTKDEGTRQTIHNLRLQLGVARARAIRHPERNDCVPRGGARQAARGHGEDVITAATTRPRGERREPERYS
ncbi:MAG: hypothetical protein MMC33_002570 [Icmadophila ericetorum]|nr:hypothetical protein [Icmadophila ericetorum]